MIYHVFANRSNIGDWLSARGIQHLLAGERITECLCDAPFVEETVARLRQAGPEDRIVIGGGGLFMDYFTPFWEQFLKARIAAPFCLWGIGCCDWKRRSSLTSRDLLEAVVRRSHICVVRDQLSRDYLAGGELPPPVPCPALAVVDHPTRPVLGVLHVDNFTIAGESVFHAMNVCARDFAQRTGRTFSQTNNRIEAGNEASLVGILQRYRRADIVVSSALHGCIIGLAMGRKVIAVSGDRKIEAFMELAGLDAWVLDVAEIDRLADRMERLEYQPDRSAFVELARRQNCEVAAAIRRAVRAESLGTG
jgi:polysaccharide pyruvyl transferase WcaK-like protein